MSRRAAVTADVLRAGPGAQEFPGRARVSAAGSRELRQSARQQAILDIVVAEGSVRIDQLAERFAVSGMTVHRDLDHLADRGLLRKHRGAATALSPTQVEANEIYRVARQQSEKAALAEAALDLVEPGHSIMIDGSTTVLQMIPQFRQRLPLTVITNTLPAMEQLAAMSSIDLLGVSGEYQSWCSSFTGALATSAISRLQADVCFLSASAVSSGRVYDHSLESIDVKQAMMKASERRVLLIDHTKFAKRALHLVAPLTDFDVVIVDAALGAGAIAGLRSSGVHVVVAGEA